MADQGVSSFVAGLSNSLNLYLGKSQDAQREAAQEEQKAEATNANQLALEKSKNADQLSMEKAKNADKLSTDTQLEDHKRSLEDTLSPDMAENAMPGYGAKMVQDYNAANPGKPLTLKQGVDYLKAAHDALKPDDKADNHQDVLEAKAMDRLTQVRGDQSVQRAEHQRDAAGYAYDTISKALSENRPLTELEQNDLIGQLWQARAGKAPTDSDMKLMNDRIGKRDLNHMITYITGDPSVIGASTDQTLANLKQFIVATGIKADQNHEAYMNPRLIKPTGLDDDRWQHISTTTRGTSFKDQMSISDKTYSNPGNRSVKPGDVVKGYVYKGGDKADPASWEKSK